MGSIFFSSSPNPTIALFSSSFDHLFLLIAFSLPPPVFSRRYLRGKAEPKRKHRHLCTSIRVSSGVHSSSCASVLSALSQQTHTHKKTPQTKRTTKGNVRSVRRQSYRNKKAHFCFAISFSGEIIFVPPKCSSRKCAAAFQPSSEAWRIMQGEERVRTCGPDCNRATVKT